MYVKQLFVICALASTTCAVSADVAREAGRAAGRFGAGMAESINEATQAQWITIEPRSREECLAESGGVLNNMFVRCRNGRQELVRFDSKGNKVVLSERPIPTH